MASEYNRLESVLAGLSLTPTPELGRVVDLAWQIQRHRAKVGDANAPGDAVSRTSLFYACGIEDPEIPRLLSDVVNDKKFASLIGLEGWKPGREKPAPPVNVSNRLAAGLEAYRDEFRADRVGPKGLAYAILKVPEGVFADRLEGAGGSPKRAADELRKAVRPDTNAPGVRVPFEMSREGHVESALRVATELAGGGAVDAALALQGIIWVGRTDPTISPAFKELASMLGGAAGPRVDFDIPDRKADPTELFLTPPLAKSFDVARPFLERGGTMWGRDYVTLALLANDPSLDEIARLAGKDISELRNHWFRFVCADSRHRDAEGWRAWWRATGEEPPADDAPAKKAQADEAPAEEPAVGAYLLTWDAETHHFSNFAEVARQVAKTGSAHLPWSSSTLLSPGDRVFLMRQGLEPRGIVGSGRVSGPVTKGARGDSDVATKGWITTYVEVEWDRLQERPILPLEDLIDRVGEPDLWKWEASGVPIPRKVAERLEDLWASAAGAAEEASGKRQPIETPRGYIVTDAVSPGFGDPKFRPSKHDRLNTRAQAEVFASLMVSSEVQLPFAVGLLGDWGVGKTFFMRLMQEDVEARAGRNVVEPREFSVGRVAQIEFNAWHFVDSDLWASLASHIFDRLSRELTPAGEESEVENTRRRLRRLIDSSRRISTEAEAAIAKASDTREQATGKLASIQEDRTQKEAERESMHLARIWKAVVEVRPSDEHPDWPDLQAAKQKAEKVAKDLDLAQALGTAEEAERVLVSLRELSHRGGALAQAFVGDLTGARRVVSVIVLLLLIALVAAWPSILKLADSYLPVATETASPLLTPFLQLMTLVAPGIAWARKNLGKVSSAIGYLEAIQRELTAPRVEATKPSKAEEDLQAEIDDLDAKIATQRRKIEEADRQISEAQAEIQRINSGGLVYDFLEGRVRDSRYLDRLGLISVIRKDFEKLKELLADWKKHEQDDILKHGDDEEGEPEPEAGDKDKQVPGESGDRPRGKEANGDAKGPLDARNRPIDRIILYVDDLDRCPPKRVVEVLQAVHLLLAFDLFVVVVAVDARWLERSLNESYNPWNGKDDRPLREPLHRFSAHNYLEKIFQIPFALPDMDRDGYVGLVENLLAPPDVATRPEQGEEPGSGATLVPEEPDPGQVGLGGKKPEQSDGGAGGGGLPEEIASGTAGGGEPGNDPSAVGGEEPEEGGGGAGGTAADREPETGEGMKSVKRQPLEPPDEQAAKLEEERRAKALEQQRVAGMRFEPREEAFIKALSPFIETPRLVKRFVNIYRLLRVSEATEPRRLTEGSEPDKRPLFEVFVDPAEGHYRAVLLLLAIAVGRAEFAPQLFRALMGARDGSFRSWIEQQARPSGGNGSSRGKPEGDGGEKGTKQAGSGSGVGYRDIADQMDLVAGHLEESGAGAAVLDDRLDVYATRAVMVARFSFHWAEA